MGTTCLSPVFLIRAILFFSGFGGKFCKGEGRGLGILVCSLGMLVTLLGNFWPRVKAAAACNKE